MYIGAPVSEIYIIYCHYLSPQLCLPTGGVLEGQSRYVIRVYVFDIYIHWHYDSSTQPCWPTGSVSVWTKLRARYVHISVDVVSKYIYILQLFVYSTPLACWECACVDKIACPCTYNIVATYILSLFDIYIWV